MWHTTVHVVLASRCICARHIDCAWQVTNVSAMTMSWVHVPCQCVHMRMWCVRHDQVVQARESLPQAFQLLCDCL